MKNHKKFKEEIAMNKKLLFAIASFFIVCCVSCTLFTGATETIIQCDGHDFRTVVTGDTETCTIVRTCTKCAYQESREHNVSSGLLYEKIDGTETASVSLGDCSEKEIYIAPKVVIDGQTLTVVEMKSFMNGDFFEVYIPSTITKIDALAFMGCMKIVEIEIPDTVTNLGDAVFVSCYALDVVRLPSNTTILPEGFFTDSHGLREVYPSSVVCDANYAAFNGCDYFIDKNNLKPLQ